jgi:hypothetical protein
VFTALGKRGGVAGRAAFRVAHDRARRQSHAHRRGCGEPGPASMSRAPPTTVGRSA